MEIIVWIIEAITAVIQFLTGFIEGVTEAISFTAKMLPIIIVLFVLYSIGAVKKATKGGQKGPKEDAVSSSTQYSIDLVDQLAKLEQLHERGALNDEEFETAKAKLLK